MLDSQDHETKPKSGHNVLILYMCMYVCMYLHVYMSIYIASSRYQQFRPFLRAHRVLSDTIKDLCENF